MASPQKEHGYTPMANELLEAYINMVRFLSPYENAVWLCIFRKTYGWVKKSDWISLSQIEKMTGIRQPHVARSKKKLVLKNMIVRIGKGVGIQKDYDKWNIPNWVYLSRYSIPEQVLPKQVTELTQTGKKNLPIWVDTKETKETNTIERDFFTYYLLKTGKKYTINADRVKLIKARLKDYSLEDMKKAVDNFVCDTWEGRKDHLDLVYCIGKRNKIDNLEKWLNKKEEIIWKTP